ncbi:protein of unknown function [Maridesulfovibrio hydrothermalis AM13 = DSM 14728]|uniref:Uncharacterized protein n=1 Tax=Maridesulfovibrio hydrothermalis AM13 = DSM 14728 TaxID=1121451 RepID=L0RC66_9BACT|nr:protein of unknown function [Maridesulfovibrio hydrothermalis AM13 = DSM 14728]
MIQATGAGTIFKMRPHRLAWPRTPAFHAGDGGSNPPGDATKFQGLIRKNQSFSFFREKLLTLPPPSKT